MDTVPATQTASENFANADVSVLAPTCSLFPESADGVPNQSQPRVILLTRKTAGDGGLASTMGSINLLAHLAWRHGLGVLLLPAAQGKKYAVPKRKADNGKNDVQVDIPMRDTHMTWLMGQANLALCESTCQWTCRCNATENGCPSENKCVRYEWNSADPFRCRLFEPGGDSDGQKSNRRRCPADADGSDGLDAQAARDEDISSLFFDPRCAALVCSSANHTQLPRRAQFKWLPTARGCGGGQTPCSRFTPWEDLRWGNLTWQGLQLLNQRLAGATDPAGAALDTVWIAPWSDASLAGIQTGSSPAVASKMKLAYAGDETKDFRYQEWATWRSAYAKLRTVSCKRRFWTPWKKRFYPGYLSRSATRTGSSKWRE